VRRLLVSTAQPELWGTWRKSVDGQDEKEIASRRHPSIWPGRNGTICAPFTVPIRSELCRWSRQPAAANSRSPARPRRRPTEPSFRVHRDHGSVLTVARHAVRAGSFVVQTQIDPASDTTGPFRRSLRVVASEAPSLQPASLSCRCVGVTAYER